MKRLTIQSSHAVGVSNNTTMECEASVKRCTAHREGERIEAWLSKGLRVTAMWLANDEDYLLLEFNTLRFRYISGTWWIPALPAGVQARTNGFEGQLVLTINEIELMVYTVDTTSPLIEVLAIGGVR